MNVNSLSARYVDVKDEYTTPRIGSLNIKEQRELTLKEKIAQTEIVITATTEFPPACVNLNGELEKVEFDIRGIDPAMSNTLRRIMIAEVPQMAFDRILIYNNTTLIQDEVLAHRLGLIPIKADFRQFKNRPEKDMTSIDCTKAAHVKGAKEDDSLLFHLKVIGKHQKNSTNHVSIVESSELKWVPVGNQKETMNVVPCFHDITIAKIKPKQIIDIELHAFRGIGRDHAKFSPVCTAFYRLLPTIEFTEPIRGEDAVEVKSMFSPGTVEIIDDEAKVVNVRVDANSREVFRHKKYRDIVKLGRDREVALFSVETVGALSPCVIFKESCKVLMNKCDVFLEELTRTQNDVKDEMKKE